MVLIQFLTGKMKIKANGITMKVLAVAVGRLPLSKTNRKAIQMFIEMIFLFFAGNRKIRLHRANGVFW